MTAQTAQELPQVSVVIPVRNEHSYIRHCLDSVLEQDYPKDLLEILLCLGPSEDDTEAIIREYCKKDARIHLLHNPKGTISCGLNIGIRAAKGPYIVRMDAHTEFASDYISACIDVILHTGAANVGGPTAVAGKTKVQRAVAAAYSSSFALGGGKQHIDNYEGESDTVSYGTFLKSTAESVGLFDEDLILNEDDDYNFRIANAGGKIWISPKIKSCYYPRDTYKGLVKQYFGYGLWKPAVIAKHHKPARLSHLVPAAFVTFLALGGISSLFSKHCKRLYTLILTLYLALDVKASFARQYRNTEDGIMHNFRLILIHFLLHVSYGAGFIRGIIRFMIIPKLKKNRHNDK